MEFRNEELVDREIEIAGLLITNTSLKQIVDKTGLSKKLLTAHIKNMMQKTKAGNLEALTKRLKEKFENQ